MTDDNMMTITCRHCGEDLAEINSGFICVGEGIRGQHESQCEKNPNRQEW